MERAQIVIDEELLKQVRHAARRSGRSVSAVVREALRAYVAGTEQDTSWVASLPPRDSQKQDGWSSVERSIAEGLARSARR